MSCLTQHLRRSDEAVENLRPVQWRLPWAEEVREESGQGSEKIRDSMKERVPESVVEFNTISLPISS